MSYLHKFSWNDVCFSFYLCANYQCFYIFLCLKFYFSFPFLPVDFRTFYPINKMSYDCMLYIFIMFLQTTFASCFIYVHNIIFFHIVLCLKICFSSPLFPVNFRHSILLIKCFTSVYHIFALIFLKRLLFVLLILMFSCFHIFLCVKFYFPSPFFLSIHFMLISFSLIPLVTSCLHEFQGLRFFLLPGGHHSTIFIFTQ